MSFLNSNSSNSLKVYLAGLVEGRDWDELCEERDYYSRVLKSAGFVPVDPLVVCNEIIRSRVEGNRIGEYVDAKNLIACELSAIIDCDCVLVLTGDIPSYGTIFEWAYAYYTLQKPVIVLGEKLFDLWISGQYNWANMSCNYVSPNIQDAILYMKSMLKWEDGDCGIGLQSSRT